MFRLAIIFILLATPAMAQQLPGQCSPHDAGIKSIEDQYGETITGRGLHENGMMVEMLVSQSGTWTLVVTRPDGLSCIAGAGDNWETVKPKAPGSDT